MKRHAVALALATLLVPPAAAQAADRNHDRLPDGWERANHLSLNVDQRGRDQDHDGLTNRFEYADRTNPRSVDTDRDGLRDGREDADHDGVTNLAEARAATGPGAGGGTGPEHPAAAEPSGPASGAPGTGGSTSAGDPPRTEGPAEGSVSPFASVAGYEQGPGYGGTLRLARRDGTTDVAFFGERTDLQCATSTTGPWSPCPKTRLAAGVVVATAAHGPNQSGNDVWIRVWLVGPAPAAGASAPVPGPTPQPAPATPPAASPQPSPAPVAQPVPSPQPAAAPAPIAQTTPAAAPGPSAAPPDGGAIASFTGGVLTIDRPNGSEHPSAPLAAGAVITCVRVRSGAVVASAPCDATALLPGRGVGVTQRALVDGQPRWPRVDVIVP